MLRPVQAELSPDPSRSVQPQPLGGGGWVSSRLLRLLCPESPALA